MRLWWLLLLLVALGAPPAQAEPEVVVDTIVIPNRTTLRDALITSALDLPLGKEISRDELDDRLKQGKARLEALGYFRLVDIRLEKGLQRQHYRVVVLLEEESARYAGFSYNREINDGALGHLRLSDDTFTAFAGSRDLGGTGLQLELDGTRAVSALGYDELDGQYMSNSIGQESLFQLSLLNPNIAGTPWFAGAIVSYASYRGADLNSPTPDQATVQESANSVALLQGVVGRHFGLLTLSLGLERISSWVHLDDPRFTDDHELGSDLTGLACYSNKSNLTIVEPGYTLCVDGTRSYSPDNSRPYFDTEALYTFIIGAKHALTPSLFTREEWLTTVTSDDGGRTYHPYHPFDPTYDLSLKYEYVPMDHLVLGVEYGEERSFPGVAHEWTSAVIRHRLFTVTYTSPSVTLQFALLYGEPGLNTEDSYILERSAQKRLSQ